jgi:NAD(P)-dependent dehydrogenase (short-subunit alcohol dehydrogenase family)
VIDRLERLNGHVALVMGGGADGPPLEGEDVAIGNGRASAILIAREGAAVVVADIRKELADETVELIRVEGGQAEAVEVDASTPDGCRAAVDAAVNAFGGLHLLVNVLGVVDGQTVTSVDVETFDRCYAVNVRSNVFAMKYASAEMIKAGGGAIVNVSSIAALRSGAGIGYETTKAAQLALSRSAAVSLAPHNIRVNTVLLGTIDTPILRRLATPELIAQLTSRVPLGRAGTPWEAAAAIVFLLSDEAAYVTGAELLVDGAARGV